MIITLLLFGFVHAVFASIFLKVHRFFFKLGIQLEKNYFKNSELTDLTHYLLLLAVSLFVPFFGYILAAGAYYQWGMQQARVQVAQPQQSHVQVARFQQSQAQINQPQQS